MLHQQNDENSFGEISPIHFEQFQVISKSGV